VALTTDRKGTIAELAIAKAAVEIGIDVYRPMGEGGRYDLIFDLIDRLVRVQCKWARRYGDIIVVRCYSTRRTRDGLIRRPYEPGQVDAYAAYCLELDRCYFLPYEAFPGRTQIQLRVANTRNNQRLRINWAEDYEFAATLRSLGAIAQLGERCHGMAEVAGSSPAGSIEKRLDQGRFAV
jgi:hypothetical protein